MNLTIAFRHRPATQQLDELARRAVAHALDRFTDRIREVRLSLEDVNARRGGIDQRCSLSLVLAEGRTLRFSTLRDSAESAIHELADLARNALARSLQRRRRRDRRRVPA